MEEEVDELGEGIVPLDFTGEFQLKLRKRRAQIGDQYSQTVPLFGSLQELAGGERKHVYKSWMIETGKQ